MLRLALVLLFMVVPCVLCTAGAEEDDFSYRGIRLGDSRESLKVLGEELYDKRVKVFGYPIDYLIYKDGEVGILPKSNIIVDISFKDKLRKNIKRGATFYNLTKTYGKKERTRLATGTYMIYEKRRGGRLERLMLEVDSEKGHLLSWRITSLPLTEEEADAFLLGEEGKDLDSYLAEEIKIDTSALPTGEKPKLRMK